MKTYSFKFSTVIGPGERLRMFKSAESAVTESHCC
uniref:Uncharacterized protein n=1 Tax=Anguilla anguilla TaxID=7936 RepID=A0A0E9Q455_ANGAN